MKNGPYTLVVAPEEYPGKKYRGRYCYEHTLEFWLEYGEVPAKGYEIHHKNMDHRDNRIENLQLMTRKEHNELHAKLNIVPLLERNCDFCKEEFTMANRNYRFLTKKGQKTFCCSRNCAAKLKKNI